MVNPRPILECLPFIEDVLQQFPTLRAIRVFDMARERGYRGSADPRSDRRYRGGSVAMCGDR
jgi:hypothetical protein